MPLTYIDTQSIPPVHMPGAGNYSVVVSHDLCGAKNVVAMLRWLNTGEKLEAQNESHSHQLLYVMDGEGTITLGSQSQDVGKGAGVYLGPSEAATIQQRGAAELKLFHIVVPTIPR